MKKLFYGAALLVMAAGSFAFLPKVEEPTGQMMVVIKSNASSGSSTLATISPDGTVQGGQLSFDRKSDLSTRTQLHQLELRKLNELRTQGWGITHQQSVSYIESSAVYVETTYLLEHR